MSKTIETHLQSNEVRIPKKSSEFDMAGGGGGGAGGPAVQYFKSSFARSLSFSQGPGGGGGPYGAADQHFTRSLDFDVNYDPSMLLAGGGGVSASHQMTPASASPVFEEDLGQPGAVDDGHQELSLGGGAGIAHSNGGIVKTLWSYAKGQDIKSANNSPIKHGIGLKSNGSPGPRKSIEANEIEVLRLRKECQNLIEENRRLMNLASAGTGGGGAMYAISNGMLLHGGSGSGSLSTLGMGIPNGAGGGGGNGSYTNVESVILQTQVETLQWQLKQVDSSRHMYRAVMEEVVRFLDRCYRSLDALQAAGQIGRSKSVLQVSGANAVTANGGSKLAGQQHHGTTTINHHHNHHHHHHHDSDSSSASSPRARSSTNLIEGPKTYTKASMSGVNGRLEQQQQQQQQQSLSLINASGVAPTALHEDDCNVPPSPASSYSTFRDFTWRRSPKRTQTLPISSNEVDPEKLAQEAFRLLRTVQNLLNTQEPTLAQSTNALDSLISSTAASSCGSSTTLTGVGLSASGNGMNGGGSGSVLGSSMPTLTGINGAGGGGAGAGAGAVTAANTGAAHTANGVGTGTGGGGGVGLAGNGLINTRSTVGFSRKLNMRGSRLSVRSSTADSVHSTSSSTKTETDEDSTDRPSPPLLLSHPHHHHHLLMQHQNPMANGGHVGMANGGGGGGGAGGAGPGSIVGGPIGGSGSSSTSSTSSNSSSCSSSTTSGNGHHHHHHHNHHHTNRYSANIERIKEMMISSSAEDESGFSSMNSFQEIGLPLINSTMLSSIGSVDSNSHHGGVSSSASSADAGSNNGSGGEGGNGSTGTGAASGGGGGGGTGTGSNSGPFGLSDDSSVLRENTVIPTNAGSTVISSNSANRLGIPSSPARTTVASTTVSTSSSTSPPTTTTSSTNGIANGPAAVNGSPLRATQNSSYEHHTHFVNHRRWDSAPVVPPKLKIHTGETDTVSRVLWV
ncbi:uncharacterized protein LOC126577426 [Anopheles aquasalis]|uniref:uncharacterized protein LOC126577426 n=1 Tax=Anopheles aquasalis TaxID=42839 RepID=UPI00215AC708|nr:uncharacterized protein LOC126577426 [Anopheles aquasalis]XP_050095001.1 uncharacterized protein LOC126577426 [Anopheles aquasalis]XP_050095002.1 uncharacterized protein LOC126577426 [Anopheles aquasalis]